MKQLVIILLAVNFSFFVSCNLQNHQKEKTITVTNTLDLPRSFETVEISKQELGIKSDSNFNKYGIVEAETGKVIVFQHFDSDSDGINDVILFQPEVEPKSTKVYVAKILNSQPQFKSKVFSRFVPERTDDYAWENDRVAFRTFGPEAQRMIEQNIPGGTLTSGIDCWMKKVDYPIIDKWYEKNTKGTGSYHVDTGEGFDNYHVGPSRGCGGFGVWSNDSLFTSRNFTKWKRTTNGPIRTSFELSFADWNAGEQNIKNKEIISLDLGSNLTCVEVKINGTDEITAGITLHEKAGVIDADTKNGWFNYWEVHPEMNYEMGTAIVVAPKYFKAYRKYLSETKDFSHLFVQMKVQNNEVRYYTGFFWTGSNQFRNKQEWESYLTDFTVKLKNPLKVEIK